MKEAGVLQKGDEVKNRDLWVRLYALYKEIKKVKNKKIEFIKVKGHAGNTYNEKCDVLARNAITKISYQLPCKIINKKLLT